MANKMKQRQDEDKPKTKHGIAHLLRSAPNDFLVCLMFFTRLPVSLSFDHTAPMSRASQMFPVVGLITGLLGSLVLAFATLLQLPAYAVSLLAVTSMIVATGALHEDGLADMVDGFGGGNTPDRKLEIMKDSQIGTFGVLALVLSQGFRIILIASLILISPALAIAALIASQMVSRACSMLLWAGLPPARSNGLSHQAGTPERASVMVALAIAFVASLCLMLFEISLVSILVTNAVSGLVSYFLIRLCSNQIHGQTGDTIGATQQLCDLAFMACILMSVGISKELL